MSSHNILQVMYSDRLLNMAWCLAMCMFDKFHLTFNFKSKVSRDVFKKENECQLISTFLFKKCHLKVTCLVVYVILVFKLSVDMFFFFTCHTTCQNLNCVCQSMCNLFLCKFLRVKCQKYCKNFVKNIHYKRVSCEVLCG